MKQKDFFIKEIKPLLNNWEDADGCIATDSIMVHGAPIAYMYRDEPNNEYDSGWCFLAAEDNQEYLDNPDNSGIYALNTVCNYAPDIMPLLNAPCGSAFARDENGIWIEEA